MRRFALISSVLTLVAFAAVAGCTKKEDAAATTAPAPKTDAKAGAPGQMNDSHTVTPTRPTFQAK